MAEPKTAEKMTTKKTKFLAAGVLPQAEFVRQLLLAGDPLFGANIRCEIAGSLRRGQREVGDVEMVIEPTFDEDLFGSPLPTSSALEGAIDLCVERGLLIWDRDVPRNGLRHKRLIFPALSIPLDLFVTTGENWGNILAIRTGDADFSRLLVTQRYKGGLLPDSMRHGDGRLLARAQGYPDFRQEPEPNSYMENVLACPTEAAFFAFLGLDVPLVHLRTASSARFLTYLPELGQAADDSVEGSRNE